MPETPPVIVFPPFTLDVSKEQLWRDSQPLALRPKSFAVLRYLVEHRDVLVTKEALLDAVWAKTIVTDAALKTCIRELRQALEDDDKTPRFIETVHGRGYRFLGRIISNQHSVVSRKEETKGWRLETSPPSLPASSLKPLVPNFVGREADLAFLHERLERMLRGERQIVFISGEPGIGKTTLINTFLKGLRNGKVGFGSSSPQFLEPKAQFPVPDVWVAVGQCIEQYGAGEAYMPLLEALGRLCREPGGERLIAILHQYAPMWLVQMSAVLSPAEVETLHRKTQYATRERMLRELAEAIVALTAERPLILRLEDLHWSDSSTLKLLAVLASWHAPTHLLVIGTYRPAEMLVNDNPLRALIQELKLHKQCEELQLGLLTERDMCTYLTERFAGVVSNQTTLHTLAREIHARTEGNPLFMVTVVDDLNPQKDLDNGKDVLRGVPATIQQMIERHVDRLRPEEQRVLEVASMVGADFSAAAVAAGLMMTVNEVEACCSTFARREQFIRATGVSEWPDGTIATRYRFLHALYQEVLYERIPVGTRVSLHRQIGVRLEEAYRDQARDIANELALHCERGHDYARAITYLQYAGETALQRHAPSEAISHLTRALHLLPSLLSDAEHDQRELTLQLQLGTALIAAQGYAASAVEQAYTRAQELCLRVGTPLQVVQVLYGLWVFYAVRGYLSASLALGK